MVEILDKDDTYQADFARLHGAPPLAGAAWLDALRAQAMDRFLELGWPTLGHEAWRYTSVKPIAQVPFRCAPSMQAAVGERVIAPYRLDGDASAELVFVDGHYRFDLSKKGALPKGVQVCSLAALLRHDPEVVRPYLARYAETQDDAFTALNTAFIDDGAFILIPRGVVVDHPIHILLLASASASPLVSHPRHLVVAEAGSRATVIQTHAFLGDAAPGTSGGGVYWANAVTEAIVGADADLHHYLVEQDGPQAFNIATLRIQQEARSRFESHTALLGGALIRNNVHVVLGGDDCHSLVNGLFIGGHRQQMDNNMRVVHAALRGDSRQFYKGILDGHAHGVFTGRIIVKPGAQKTDAKQTNRNLLLSDDAQIDTRPQLEIYADDVKCTHGATTGRLDEAALFYLESRGIDPEAARGLLIYAFARESLQRMGAAAIRGRLERLLVERLPQPELLQTLLESAGDACL